jgi:hypothetical protein
VAAPACAIAALASDAILSPPVLSVRHICKVIGPGHRADNDIAAMAAVAAIGTTARHILLPSEAATAPPPITTFDVQSHSIDKHDFSADSWPNLYAGIVCPSKSYAEELSKIEQGMSNVEI